MSTSKNQSKAKSNDGVKLTALMLMYMTFASDNEKGEADTDDTANRLAEARAKKSAKQESLSIKKQAKWMTQFAREQPRHTKREFSTKQSVGIKKR